MGETKRLLILGTQPGPPCIAGLLYNVYTYIGISISVFLLQMSNGPPNISLRQTRYYTSMIVARQIKQLLFYWKEGPVSRGCSRTVYVVSNGTEC